MSTKRLIAVGTVALLLLSGCAPYYRYYKRSDGGYVIKKWADSFPEFTIDDTGEYPSDLTLARKRFKRRRKFVVNWHKEHSPEDMVNPAITMFKAFWLIPARPLIALITLINPPSEPTAEELAESRRKRSAARQEIRNYIARDCAGEAEKSE